MIVVLSLLVTLPSLAESLDVGPGVGEQMSPFEGVDQNGERQNFSSLKGENGLYLLFFRSADW